ncbi:hypothetical protein R7P75_04705 [Vibrio sp. 2175-1]|uniref:hypothetical protein n=1 Tax=Vibrio TaxID=662 RepID=UPI001CDD4197|nr:MULTISPECIES: hypothetical protein [Vibrio]MCA2497819.1 hypothetical protein [Vibrio alginolyticus]MDW2217506.1 hypothetical protein [Vibrio sp. 2175-1]
MKTKFSNGEYFINVSTVGDLKAILEQLDDEMPIEQGFSDSVDVMIYHNMMGDPHLEFEDGESN